MTTYILSDYSNSKTISFLSDDEGNLVLFKSKKDILEYFKNNTNNHNRTYEIYELVKTNEKLYIDKKVVVDTKIS